MACDSNLAKLRHRVSLQARSRSQDGQGGYAESWAEIASLWAAIEPLKGYERMKAAQLGTPLTHKVLIRYRQYVTTTQRLVFRNRVFEIKEVINEEEANRWLRLLCVEKAESQADWGVVSTNWENLNVPWEAVG